jgi:hypothetical protein
METGGAGARAQWQDEQVDAVQPPQALPPLTGAELPLESLEKAAKAESTRRAPLLQRGQAASSFDLLIGRSSSNLISHSGQQYS